MPILAMFYGIIIRMYYADNKQHHVPIFTWSTETIRLFLVLQMANSSQGNFPKARLVSW